MIADRHCNALAMIKIITMMQDLQKGVISEGDTFFSAEVMTGNEKDCCTPSAHTQKSAQVHIAEVQVQGRRKSNIAGL